MIDKIVFMAGVRRGGQHAASGWLISQMPFPVVHNVNDIYDLSNIKTICGKNNLVIFTRQNDTIVKSTTRNPNEFWSQDIQCLIIGCEDVEVDIYPVDDINTHLSPLCDNITKILVIRDPFNTMASLYKVGRGIPQDIKRWKKLAREAMGKTDFIGFDHIFLYNKWFNDRQYRYDMAKNLGFEYRCDNKKVYDFGGGSSFDGVKYDGKPRRMDVMHRWQEFRSDNNFRKLFDNEVIELSNELFGPIDGVESLINE
ncbi:MAG: hypothetical protein GF411_13945 [Candidatus Lokiarchaeota archaeon]|nr:hypothetical protein [Candidatus Lokiarchaeota archaeon]